MTPCKCHQYIPPHLFLTSFLSQLQLASCRYQALSRERDLLNSRWDEQNNLLVQSHERVIQDLTEEYEQKLQEEQVPLPSCLVLLLCASLVREMLLLLLSQASLMYVQHKFFDYWWSKMRHYVSVKRLFHVVDYIMEKWKDNITPGLYVMS